MATRLLQSFLVGLGYDYEDEGLKKFDDDIEKVTGVVGAMVKAATAGAVALTGLVVATTSAADEQGKMAGEVRTNVEDLDALTFALVRSGGAQDGMAASLRGIARRASEASRGMGEGVEAFGLLGISVTDTNGRLKDSDVLLKEVAGAMQGLEAGRQIELAEKLGVSGSIRLLQQGVGEINALTAEAKALGTVTAEDAAIAAEFQDGLTDLWRIVKSVSLTLTRELAPIMTDMVQHFTEWWKVNRELVQQNIAGFFDKAAKAAKVLVAVMPLIAGAAVLTAFSRVLSFLRLATIRMGAFTLMTAALPLAMLIGKALFIGAVQDIYAFLDGKESFFGELLGEYPEYEPVFQAVAGYFELIRDAIQLALEGWRELLAIGDKFSIDGAKEVGKNLPGFFKDRLQAAGESLSLAGSGFLDSTGLRSFEEQGRFNVAPVQSTVTNTSIAPQARAGYQAAPITINISGVEGAEDAEEKIKQAAQDLRSGVEQ